MISAEQKAKIEEIKNLKFESLDKQGLSNICDLIINVWELEEDELVRATISKKLGEIIDFMIAKIPDNSPA